MSESEWNFFSTLKIQSLENQYKHLIQDGSHIKKKYLSFSLKNPNKKMKRIYLLKKKEQKEGRKERKEGEGRDQGREGDKNFPHNRKSDKSKEYTTNRFQEDRKQMRSHMWRQQSRGNIIMSQYK